MELQTIFGTLAAICMICGYMPQAITTIRTRQTDGIAMPTFLMMGFGSLFFMLQGLCIDNWPLFITNSITLICSVIIVAIKIHNDRTKHRNA